MTRITGLATGLDVDSVVKETMQAYQTKIDTVDQQKKVAELQQEMYRNVIKECRNFYDDYFDISKSDSILLQRNWGTTTFESSNSAVSVTGNGGAEVAKYSVEVTSLAKAASYTVDPDKLNGTIYVNNVKVELGTDKTTEEKVKLINSALKGKGVTAKYSDFEKGIVIKTEKLGSDQSITLGGSKTIDEDSDFFTKKVDEYKNSVNKDTRDEKKEIFEFEYNGKKITVDAKDGVTEDKIKDAMKEAGISIETKEDGKFSLTYEDSSKNLASGTDCKATITKDGKTYEVEGNKNNSITLDGVTFKFNSVTTEEVKITGKTDTKAIKDKLVKFVDDYNKIMEKLNTLINEKRDKDYMPLTEAQKEEMTDKQIELWEKKVKEGQLSRDSDLIRIRNSMKNAMSSLSGGTGESLAAFGIKPVSDYNGNKNGTFTIDEEALNKALENDIENVMNTFIASSKNDSDKGALQKLKSIFDTETQSSTSALIKKAGMEGSSTASNNTLSNKIKKYEEKISRMETIFSTKQQALYSKYARLETLMNNLNSQSSYLTSMFSS